MNNRSVAATAQLRPLESWLPLAQTECERSGWGYERLRLEQRVVCWRVVW